jgi:hypothetical protein
MNKFFHVRLRVRKVQSYLFRFPKWRFIVGANSRLGELFAHDLPALRKDASYSRCPLTFPNSPADFQFDNPQENMASGTICSAGGNYEGLFEKAEHARDFCHEAAKLINRDLPDFPFGITMKEFSKTASYSEFEKIPSEPVDTSVFCEPFYGLPDLQISADDGSNPVNKRKQSDLIEHMNEQKREFFRYYTKDFLCEFLKNTGIQFWPDENDDFDTERLSELSRTRNKNQIAMVTMDGNKMGIRFRGMINRFPKNISALDAFIQIERFWWASRNRVRTAMKTVLKKVAETRSGNESFPVWPIFLGGDDVMLLTVPELALELVLGFAEELEKSDPEHTVSAGIAVVKNNYPLAQAHQLAESCLSSAKKEAYRTGKSALDWHILYDSQTTEIEEIRRRDYMLPYRSGNESCIDVLSCRPCTMGAAAALLQSSRNILKKVAQEERGMNKYKALRTILRQGKPMAAYQMLYLGLADSALIYEEKKVGDQTIHLSRALDVIELSELYRTVD